MEEKELWLKEMKHCANGDIEGGHCNADDILCKLVEKYCPFGAEVVAEFKKLDKWYA